MKLHRNAALSLKKREVLVSRVIEDNWSLTQAAAAAEVSERTAGKWVRRFTAEGSAGLLDRSSAPKHVHNRTDERRVQVIARLRRLRMTGAEIAEVLRMPETTVSGLLKKIGMGKLGRIGLEPAERYERKRPGELIHVDVKKLGRIEGGAGKHWRAKPKQHPRPTFTDAAGRVRKAIGWEFVHVAVDDATRMAYVEVLSDETAKSAVAFLGRAVRFFRRHGIKVERVMTDNGSPYVSRIHALACRILGVRHLRTRPYRPQTNGKAERFIRTMLGGWAYGAVYGSSAERTAALDGWLWRYNHQRPHGSLGRKPPSARLAELKQPARVLQLGREARSRSTPARSRRWFSSATSRRSRFVTCSHARRQTCRRVGRQAGPAAVRLGAERDRACASPSRAGTADARSEP